MQTPIVAKLTSREKKCATQDHHRKWNLHSNKSVSDDIMRKKEHIYPYAKRQHAFLTCIRLVWQNYDNTFLEKSQDFFSCKDRFCSICKKIRVLFFPIQKNIFSSNLSTLLFI